MFFSNVFWGRISHYASYFDMKYGSALTQNRLATGLILYIYNKNNNLILIKKIIIRMYVIIMIRAAHTDNPRHHD
jgi:hypothetical protein